MMTLYIEGVKLDTPQDFFFTMTYRSSWFTSIDKITLSYSGTISIPKTANNTAALGAIISPSSVSDAPYKYLNADVMQDGIMFLKGAQVYLQQVTDDGYKLSLVWGDMNALKRMKDDEKELTELRTTKSDFIWDYVSTNDFPRINDGRDSVLILPKFPSVKVRTLISKICAHYGILQPPEEDLSRIDDWVNPLLNRIDPIITDGEKYTENNEWTTEFCGVERTSDKTVMDYNVYMYKGHSDDRPPIDSNKPGGLASNQEVYQITRELRGIGIGGNADSRMLSFVPLYSNIKILSRGKLRFRSYGVFNFDTGLALKLIYSYRKIDKGNYTEDAIMTIEPLYSEEHIITNEDGSTTSAKDFIFEWDDESDLIPYVTESVTDIYKDLDARLQWRISNSNIFNEIIESQVVISSRMEYIVNNAPYYNFANYPKMKMLEYIKNIATMAGKFVYIENYEDNFVQGPRLRMVSYDDVMHSNDVYDWSRYADSELRDMTFTAGDWSQRNIFAYKENDDYTDTYTMTIASEVLKDKYEINVPFTSARYDSNGALVVKRFGYEEDEYGDSYSYNGVELLKGFNVYKGNDDKMYIGRVENSEVKMLPWSELMANYESIFATLQQMKVVKETMRLPLMVLRDLNLHKLVYIDKYGCYFAILQIRTRNNGTCDVELLKI